MSYDRAITVFSPDGHLFQVDYAQEAVKKGSTAVGVRGKNVVVLGVEKKTVAKLQEDRTVRKICSLDDNIFMAFAGLTADARIIVNRARVECQSHRLTVEDPATVEYITRYISSIKQANAIGRSAKTVREFLEKNYKEDMESDTDTIRLAIRALLEVVQSGGKNIELAIMKRDESMKILVQEEIEEYVTAIETEKQKKP
ncbi:proteasome subunit alpha type-7-like isoform X3 [Oncorhynchus clarkii lewisi]|uniref:proteasome subunit alpha type-7-like isoform X3 n=1 Tax=Oncorhynchus clarkii lewisi TaxID=490388 RepID=UPI0039B9A031